MEWTTPIPAFYTQSNNCYDRLEEFIFFFLVFFLDKIVASYMLSLFFVYYSVIKLRYI